MAFVDPIDAPKLHAGYMGRSIPTAVVGVDEPADPADTADVEVIVDPEHNGGTRVRLRDWMTKPPKVYTKLKRYKDAAELEAAVSELRQQNLMQSQVPNPVMRPAVVKPAVVMSPPRPVVRAIGPVGSPVQFPPPATPVAVQLPPAMLPVPKGGRRIMAALRPTPAAPAAVEAPAAMPHLADMPTCEVTFESDLFGYQTAHYHQAIRGTTQAGIGFIVLAFRLNTPYPKYWPPVPDEDGPPVGMYITGDNEVHQVQIVGLTYELAGYEHTLFLIENSAPYDDEE